MQYLVHKAIFYCLLSAEVEVPVGIPGYLIKGLAGMLGQDIPYPVLDAENLLSNA